MPDTPHAKHVAQPQMRTSDAQRRLEESKQQVLALLRDCQFAEALVRLVPLTRPQGPGSGPYVAWAQQELARLRALPPDVVQKGPMLVSEAIKLLAQQNFVQVIRLLDCIPAEFRPPEAVSLLQQARVLQGEVEQLNERMQQAIHNRQYDGLRESVLARLLEVEPGNLTARDLYEHLGTYGPGEALRFDKDGMVLPARGKYWWLERLAQLLYQRLTRRTVPRGKAGVRRTGEPASADEARSEVPWIPIAIGLGLVGLLLFGTVLILRMPKGTVVVEINEPNAVVSVDDGKLTFTTTEAKQPIELRLSKGEHTVTVTREGAKPYTRRLLVKKGQTETIRVDLATAAIQETGGASSGPSTLAASSSTGPPASAAPAGPPDAGALLMQKRPFQWFGYAVSGGPSAVLEIAPYTNFIYLKNWREAANADEMVEAARKNGLKVVLGLPPKQTWNEMEELVRPLVAKHRDAVVAACWGVTYHFSDWTPEKLAENSRRLKQACLHIPCWAEFVEEPRGQLDPLPIPPEVDGILVNFYYDKQPASVRGKANHVFANWMSKANGRPVLFHWVAHSVSQTTPDTLRMCAEVGREFGCAGICFYAYGVTTADGKRGAAIDANPALVQEIKAIARESGFAK